uniref:Uncharacterized protein n=1 Tax=Solanum lycopersicum TaxID=4081 RepID=A0A3Q7EWS2_SOLLC
MKRDKRLVLEKLEGSYIDEFNKLEGYAQELKNSNPGTDVIINISREALEQGKRRFLRIEAYMLIYMHKIQPVRGDKFWKLDPSHAIEPPEIHKLVGRPKLKRKREKDEARKREGVWSASRKGLKMMCEHCSATASKIKTTSPRCACVNTPTIQEEYGIMSTPGFVASSSQQSSQPDGPSKSKEIEKNPTGPSKSKRKIIVYESEDGKHVEPSIAIRQTGTRRIDFKGDENGVSIPTNLPYSPRKLAWKGKEATTSDHFTIEKEKRIGKLKAKRGGMK